MIKGKLVGLRAVEREDLEIFKHWRNIESFRKNFREVRELNQENQESWFEKSCVDNPNDFMFTIVDINSGKPIGACGLLYINWVIRSADFSFYIGKDELYIDNDGYAEEAARLLISYGFGKLNLNKVWMELYEFDGAKIDFFGKVFNFKVDGHLRQNCFHNGKYYNGIMLSLLNSESTLNGEK